MPFKFLVPMTVKLATPVKPIKNTPENERRKKHPPKEQNGYNLSTSVSIACTHLPSLTIDFEPSFWRTLTSSFARDDDEISLFFVSIIKEEKSKLRLNTYVGFEFHDFFFCLSFKTYRNTSTNNLSEET